MNNLNSILIEGSLTADPLFNTTPKGTPLCKFNISSLRKYRNEDGSFIDEDSHFSVEAWAKLAEQVFNMGREGRNVRVVGRLKEDRWDDTDGKQHSAVSIVAEHVEFSPAFNRQKQGGKHE